MVPSYLPTHLPWYLLSEARCGAAAAIEVEGADGARRVLRADAVVLCGGLATRELLGEATARHAWQSAENGPASRWRYHMHMRSRPPGTHSTAWIWAALRTPKERLRH